MALSKRHLALAATATTLGLGGMLLPGASAMAATTPDQGAAVAASESQSLSVEKDGNCEVGELCLFWWQNYSGAAFDLYLSDPDFSDDAFSVDPAWAVDNNTRSYWSQDDFYWRVYDGANYSGEELLCIAPGDRGNFNRADWDRASSAAYSSEPC
jgi:Peptidase inhibitor family I36